MSAGAGQHPDSQHTATTIQNQWRGEFNGHPLGVLGEKWATLSLPLHVSLSSFHFLSVSGQQHSGTGCWQQVADTPRFSAVRLSVSQLSIRLLVSSFHACYNSETLELN